MIYLIDKNIENVNAYHNQLKIEFGDIFNGLNIVDSQITAEFTVELTPEQLLILQSIKPIDKKSILPVTPRQIRQALVLSGSSLSEIEDGINMLPEPQKTLAKIEWEYSTVFDRNWPSVQLVAEALGYTEEDLDDLWNLASTL